MSEQTDQAGNPFNQNNPHEKPLRVVGPLLLSVILRLTAARQSGRQSVFLTSESLGILL